MLKIYNTQTRQKQELKPVQEGKIKMYVCGPTVYNRIHIGNARTFIAFDIIRRYLMWRGYEVCFVQNITDVDDKIIMRAAQENTTASEIAKKYTDYFIQDMHLAGVLDPDIRPKATQEIDSMIELVQSLIDNGHAYVKDGDVYFDVRSFKGYGSLSGRDVEDAESGHRSLQSDGQGLEDRKKAEADFALWKTAKPGEPSWDSPWGPGRPGWHIECSAMSHKYLGLPFDIHGGGADLIFPHHENERAQSMCGYKSSFANYWMHSGMLQITNEGSGKNEKMSKSLNNFILLHEALEQVRPSVMRMLVLQTHYRSPLIFGEKRLEEANSALTRIENTVKNLDWKINNLQDVENSIDTKVLEKQTKELKEKFIDAMDDDFNCSKALAEIFNFINIINSVVGENSLSKDSVESVKNSRDIIVELMNTFGVVLEGVQNQDETGAGNSSQLSIPKEIIDIAKQHSDYSGDDINEASAVLLEARTKARKNKEWEVADSIRNDLLALGIQIEDTPQGPRLNY